jgi:hypothetical protein
MNDKKKKASSVVAFIIISFATASIIILAPPPAAYGQLAAIADLTPPLSNVEWFELAEERTEIDTDAVKENVDAALQDLVDMKAATQELDAESVAAELSDLSEHNWEIKYELSYTAPPSNITVAGGGGGGDSEEEGDDEASEEIAPLEQARAINPLTPRNFTNLNVTAIDQLISDVEFNIGYLLGIFGDPGGIVSQAAYDKIQETANKLFEIRDRVTFTIPVEEVQVIGKIANVPASRQEALQEDAGTTTIFTI